MKLRIIAGAALLASSIAANVFAAENCVQYLDTHPAVSQARTNPNLIYNQHYLNQHPEFKQYLNKHPGICENYARGHTQWKKNQYEHEYSNQPYPAGAQTRAHVMHNNPGQMPPPGTYNYNH